MEDNKLIIGMPAGSLANSNRGGNLISILETAGFKTSGYESGGPSKFTTFNYLYGWDGRPQEFATQLNIDEIDVAIAGDDWIRERIYELKLQYNTGSNMQKVLSLKRGGVRIVGIVRADRQQATMEEFMRDLTDEKDLITVVSEMPYLALNWLQENLEKIGKLDAYKDFSVQKYKTPASIKKGILIYETWGKTEAKVKNGGADIGMEITQSGSAIRNYGLRIIDEVITSETGIYVNPEIKNNPAKYELLRMFLLNLYGAVNAEKKVMILFNVHNEDIEKIEQYLSDKNLFADEPTINKGRDYTQYSIQIETGNKENPLAKIRYDLANLNAKNIDTIPIESSIPGLDVLGI